MTDNDHMITKLPVSELATQPEENIFLRGMNELSWQHEPIVYEFTNDPALLHQYYQLREHMYRKVFETEKFDGTEDVYDKISHILVARKGKLCVGGCRLTIREPHEEFLLPMESNDFKLKKALPEFELDTCRHGEISRLAVMEGGFEREVMFNLVRLTGEKVVQQQLDHVFVRSTYAMARNWRYVGSRVSNYSAKILHNVEVPENPIHPEVKWYITAFSEKSALSKPQTKHKKPSQHTNKPLVH